MASKTNYSPLLIVAILFIIGANFPSNGVDDVVYKSPGELIDTALKILTVAVLVVVFVKSVHLAGSVRE